MNGGSTEEAAAWSRAADAREAELPKLGAYPVAGLLRRARRIAGVSQRELARRVGVSPSTVGRIESGAIVPVLPTFARMIAVAGLWLAVVDEDGHVVQPMRDIDDIRNGGGRLYPSHLDTILDPRPGEWWGDQYGLARPPETFHRDPRRREAQRVRSVYSVREIWSYGLGDMSAMPPELRDEPAAGPMVDSPATAANPAIGSATTLDHDPDQPTGPATTLDHEPHQPTTTLDHEPHQPTGPAARLDDGPGQAESLARSADQQAQLADAFSRPFPIGFRRRRKRS